MADYESELQQAIYDALTGNAELMAALPGGVHDHVGEGTDYPYAVIDEFISSNADTKDDNGFDTVVHIHSWSRYRGKDELRAVMGKIYAALHHAELPMPNYHVVYCDFDGADDFREEDGITRHGVQRFRVFAEEA